MGRSLVMGFGSGALLILALFLFDLLVVEHRLVRAHLSGWRAVWRAG